MNSSIIHDNISLLIFLKKCHSNSDTKYHTTLNIIFSAGTEFPMRCFAFESLAMIAQCSCSTNLYATWWSCQNMFTHYQRTPWWNPILPMYMGFVNKRGSHTFSVPPISRGGSLPPLKLSALSNTQLIKGEFQLLYEGINYQYLTIINIKERAVTSIISIFTGFLYRKVLVWIMGPIIHGTCINERVGQIM